MAGRKKIGLVFVYNEQWIGGTYYIMNLINALNSLSDNQKPFLYIFSRPEDYAKLVEEVPYPYMQYVHMEENPEQPLLRWLNKVSIRFFSRKVFRRRFRKEIDAIFPFQRNHYLDAIPLGKRIYWIADFQDRRLPEFFSAADLKEKAIRHQWIADNAQRLVLSSEDAFSDFKTFYPSASCRVHIIHFAVTHPEFRYIDFAGLSHTYGLDTPYFFSPNQFWAHKNQRVVIDAAALVKAKGKKIRICFSGKETDNRNPGYAEGLKNYVREKGLEAEISFLGFLDRKEQLQIMNHALAVIQPSRFEGWSTSVEDAMAIGKPVVASALNVNKEQLKDKGFFFDPSAPAELAAHLEALMEKTPDHSYCYEERVKAFAEDFLSILEN
jgi:glycosyltransferase involved in cell wall biosynthesis